MEQRLRNSGDNFSLCLVMKEYVEGVSDIVLPAKAGAKNGKNRDSLMMMKAKYLVERLMKDRQIL